MDLPLILTSAKYIKNWASYFCRAQGGAIDHMGIVKPDNQYWLNTSKVIVMTSCQLVWVGFVQRHKFPVYLSLAIFSCFLMTS